MFTLITFLFFAIVAEMLKIVFPISKRTEICPYLFRYCFIFISDRDDDVMVRTAISLPISKTYQKLR